jgi:hypothetical protein
MDARVSGPRVRAAPQWAARITTPLPTGNRPPNSHMSTLSQGGVCGGGGGGGSTKARSGIETALVVGPSGRGASAVTLRVAQFSASRDSLVGLICDTYEIQIACILQILL